MNRSSTDYFLMAASLAILFSIKYWREILELLERFETVLPTVPLFMLPLLIMLALTSKTGKYKIKQGWKTYRIEFLKYQYLKEKLVEIPDRVKDFLVEAFRTNYILGLHLSFEKGYPCFYLLVGGGEDCLEKIEKDVLLHSLLHRLSHNKVTNIIKKIIPRQN